MPELPEVEVTRRRLEPEWVGRRITHAIAGAPSYFFLTPPRKLVGHLTGRTTRTLERHGKYLLARFDGESRLLCHLGMTGQLYTVDQDRAEILLASDPHVHLALWLSAPKLPPRVLVFRDVRKFGKVEWICPGVSPTRLAKLGPDALALGAHTLHEALRGRKIPIKTALLDQQITAGVGNIYADEALFTARIDPIRPACSLSLEECNRTVKALRQVLKAAIRSGGSTISDFLQADGLPGAYQGKHRVYGRAGAPCSRCRRPIERVVLAQRSTHFCPSCQT